jgi:hypothetical protein
LKLLSILALLLVVGCSENSSSPTLPEESIYNGDYEITAVAESNSCSRTIPSPPETVTVDVDGETIVFGSFRATFIDSTKSFEHSDEGIECTETGGGCYHCPFRTVNVMFTDSEHFEGTYSLRVTYIFACDNQADCTAEWTISGTKIP